MFTALSEQITAVLKRLTGRGVLSEADVTEALREIRRHLLEADVGPDGRLVGTQHAAPLQFASVGPTLIVLVGLQGSGKTTTAAKLARRLKLEQKTPCLVAADGYRPAAADQLRQLAVQVGVPVFGA